MSIRITYKSTVWSEVVLNEDNENFQKISEKIKSKKDFDLEDLWEIGCQSEVLMETEENLIPEDNDNQATIEIYDEKGLIYSNEKQIHE
jgi:hypothetical protein